MNRPVGYIDVDRLQAETNLQEAAANRIFPLEVKGSNPEVCIDCPFGCPCHHSGRNEIAINTDNPQKIFQCHSYGCGFRGNLLTLMHGFLATSKPTGGKLKGEEFQRVKKVLTGTGQPIVSGSALSASAHKSSAASATRPAAENSPRARSSARSIIHTALLHLGTQIPPVSNSRYIFLGERNSLAFRGWDR